MIYKRNICTARKEHYCDSCSATIRPGSIYLCHTGIGGDISENSWSTLKECSKCAAETIHVMQNPFPILPDPVGAINRMIQANHFIEALSRTNRKFFLNWQKDVPDYVAFFYIKGRELMWVDDYIRKPVHITRPSLYFTGGRREKFHNCSQGSTLTKVLEELTEFILTGIQSDYIRRLLPYEPMTGFDKDSEIMIMHRAVELGIVKPYLPQTHPESA